MAKHTPGPWYAEEGNAKREGFQPGWDVWHESGIGCVARVHPGLNPDPTAEANARLIAAAPQLLGEVEYVKDDAGIYAGVISDAIEQIKDGKLPNPAALAEVRSWLRIRAKRAAAAIDAAEKGVEG